MVLFYHKSSIYSETETLYLQWANGSAPVGEVKRFSRFGKFRYYEKTENGSVELSRAQYNERMKWYAEDIDRRVQRKVSNAADQDGNTKGNATGYSDGNRNDGGASAVSGQTIGEELRNDAGGSVRSGGRYGSGTAYSVDEQNQQRTNTLTDREVLQYAASELSMDKLTDGERDALKIFNERLSKLEDLQEKRAEQGRLYREQQFGAKVDREAAKATHNRMQVLDEQIKRASEAVLSVEDKAVLKRVLQKARGLVEQQEREKGQEMLKRWRDRRNNAASIKKYRERIRGDVDELTRWVLHPNNKDAVKHIPDALKNTVIPFLTSIDFTSKQQLRGGTATKADAEFMKKLNALKGALKQNMDLNGLYSGYNDLPPDFMENLQTFIDSAQAIVEKNSGEYVINRMTSEELRELSMVVRTLKKYITQMNRFHANAMYQHVYEAGDKHCIPSGPAHLGMSNSTRSPETPPM